MKRTWIMIAGLMISVLAVLGLTVIPAMAQDAESETPEQNARCQAYQEKVAEHLDVGIEDLQSAIVAAKIDIVNEAVTNGNLTQEQADEILERIEENGACARIMPRFHRGHGEMGERGPRGGEDQMGMQNSDFSGKGQRGDRLGSMGMGSGA